MVRDTVLTAVKQFNKAHPKDKLNSSHLGLAGEKKPVFVSEHLTPANKQLHAAARKTAKDKNIEFVWVQNGRVFMRKDKDAIKILVKDLDVLKSL